MEQIVPEKLWMAIYTKPRNEKKANDRLSAQGIETYLPLHETIRQWSDRKQKIKIPLFTSYVFVKATEKERLEILKDPSVLNFVFWLGKPAIIREIEIEKIKFLLKESNGDDIVIEDMEPGDKAIVTSGHFTDEIVTVIHTEKKEYIVMLQSLGIRLRLSKLNLSKK